MRTSNPVLSDKALPGYRGVAGVEPMTIQGTVNKTFVLLLFVLLTSAWTWNMYYTGNRAVGLWLMGGAIGGLVLALVTVFKQQWAAVTAPLYALAEGLVLGGISAMLEARYSGIVITAVGLTFGTLFGLLFAYKSGMIRATEKFKLGVFAATGGIALVYLVTMILGLFHIKMPYIHDSGWVGIGFSVFVVIIAALNLVLDFDFIETAAGQGAPKYMEWYGAFGLMVTLIWLYIEILRLLTKMKERR